MEPERFLDPLVFLRELHGTGIRVLLVGRQALVALGAPLMTADYDFYLAPDPESLERLLALARTHRLEVSAVDPERRPFFSLLSDNLKLDFFRASEYAGAASGRLTFDELWDRRQILSIEDFEVGIPGVEDLISIKRIRNSPKDQEDIKYLQVLLERQGGGESRSGHRR